MEGTEIEVAGPRYRVIAAQIEHAIKSGLLPNGAVLTEDPIAKLFESSRTPVRTAFGFLKDQGLLQRFDGRGFIVANKEETTPVRINITYDMLGLSQLMASDATLLTSERIHGEFEDVLVHALPFGKFRINEQGAADYYQVSRTVIRDILSRLQVRGIVRKDRRSHWVVGPLTAEEIAHYYAIRAKLEPLALEESALLVEDDILEGMTNRLESVQLDAGKTSVELLGQLETDLHKALLSKSPNPHLLRMVNQSQLPIVVNRVFASFVGTQPFDDAWQEHALIFDFVKRGNYRLAAQALEEHLNQAAQRTSKRLMAISVFPPSEPKSYLVRVDA